MLAPYLDQKLHHLHLQCLENQKINVNLLTNTVVFLNITYFKIYFDLKNDLIFYFIASESDAAAELNEYIARKVRNSIDQNYTAYKSRNNQNIDIILAPSINLSTSDKGDLNQNNDYFDKNNVNKQYSVFNDNKLMGLNTVNRRSVDDELSKNNFNRFFLV